MARLASPSTRQSGWYAVKKTKAKKNAAAGLSGAAFREEMGDYLASPSSAGLSERSTGLSPSQIRRIAL